MFDIFIVNSSGKLKEKFPFACEVHQQTFFKAVCWAAQNSSTELFWVVSDIVDYTDFDFSFEPQWHQRDHLHVWPRNNQTLGGETVLVNRQKWIEQNPQSMLDYQPLTQHTQSLKSYNTTQKICWQSDFSKQNNENVLRHIGDRTSMFNKTLRHAESEYVWITSDTVDYTGFDFDWLPNWGEHDYIHVWPTNNQTRGGDTFFVPLASLDCSIESIEHYEKIVWHENTLKYKQPTPVVIWNTNCCEENLNKIKDQVPAAIELRYIGDRKSMIEKTIRTVGQKNFWVVDDSVDYSNFDFEWQPSWNEETQLHVWSTKNQNQHGETMWVPGKHLAEQLDDLDRLENYKTVNWHCEKINSAVNDEIFIWNTNSSKENLAELQNKFPDAKTLRYVGDHLSMMQKTLRHCERKSFWILCDTIDYADFDFSFQPNWSEDTQLHVWTTNGDNRNGDTFWVPAAKLKNQIENLECLSQYNTVKWHCDYLYTVCSKPKIVWSNKKHSDLHEKYFYDAVVLRKFGDRQSMIEKTVRHATSDFVWVLNDDVDYTDFNFYWTPSWAEEDQLHVWPTNNQTRGGSTMLLPVAELKKQINDINSIQQFQTINWHSQSLAKNNKTPVVIWSTGNHEHLVKKHPNATVLRYVGDHFSMMQKTLRNCNSDLFWVVSDSVNYTDFDFDWLPNWAEEDQLHVWPTNNQTRGGDTFWVNKRSLEQQINQINKLEEYDSIAWHTEQKLPTVEAPPVVIWSTGNHEHLVKKHPNATVLRYVGDHFSMMQKTLRNVSGNCFWVVSDWIKYDNFDFSWTPNWAEETQLHVWPTNNQTRGGDTFWVPRRSLEQQIDQINKLDEYNSIAWHRKNLETVAEPEIVVWDSGKNSKNIQEIQTKNKNITVLRYTSDHFSMMQKTLRNVSDNHFWVVSDFCDYTVFDFSWTPNWAEETQLHVWPTNNQTRGGDTFWVPRRSLEQQIDQINKLDEYNSIAWHKQSVLRVVDYDIFVWDMGGQDNNISHIKEQYPECTVLRYHGNHFDMLKRTSAKAKTDFFWVLSSCCDYKTFNSKWQPDWQYRDQLHVWASGKQIFGDTFLVPKKHFDAQVEELTELDYFDSICWHESGYPRLPWPVNYVETHDLYHAITNHKFSSVYEYFIAPGSTLGSTVDASIWKKRRLIAYNNNGHVLLSPRDALSAISDKILSYPYIQYHNCEKSTQTAQDIVFISYDEKDADLNWNQLKNRFPRAHRVHGVDGMVNALKAAAQEVSTPWFFAVFGKTKLVDSFKFDFSPNYLDKPGNYIFHAYNTITDYTYGHGAVVMYHTDIVKNAVKWGYDFTTSFHYTLIPELSCINDPQTKWEAWRTSFREVLKLKEIGTVEAEYRMHRWLTVGNGPVGYWSIQGAKDAVNFAGSLENANDWHWLKSIFEETLLQNQ